MLSPASLLYNEFRVKKTHSYESKLQEYRKPFSIEVCPGTKGWLGFQATTDIENMIKTFENKLDADTLSKSLLCHVKDGYESIYLFTENTILSKEIVKCDVCVFKMDNSYTFARYLHYASCALDECGGQVYWVTIYPCTIYMIVQTPVTYSYMIQNFENLSLLTIQKSFHDYLYRKYLPIHDKYGDCSVSICQEEEVPMTCDSPEYICDSPEYKMEY